MKYILISALSLFIHFNTFCQSDKISPIKQLSALQGKWNIYDAQSDFIGHNQYVFSSKSDQLVEENIDRSGLSSKGMFFQIPGSNNFVYTVNPDMPGKSLQYQSDTDAHLFSFQGLENTDGTIIMERLTYNLISNDTVQKKYETSTDNGQSWTLEYLENMKRMN